MCSEGGLRARVPLRTKPSSDGQAHLRLMCCFALRIAVGCTSSSPDFTVKRTTVFVLECGSPTEWCCAEQRIISFSVVVRVLRRLVWWSIGRTQTCDRVPNAFGTRCNPSPRARSPCGTHMFSGEWTLQQHVCVNLSLVGMALLSGVCVCVVMESGLASQWLRQMEKMAETHIAHGVLSDVVVCLRPIRDPCRTPCIGCGAWST